MMTIIDILIYVAFAFFASSLARKSQDYIENYDLSTKHWDKYLTYFVLFFTIIGGIRWNVGSDCVTYSYFFANGLVSNTKEIIWTLLVKSLHSLNLHWTVGLAFCMLVQIFFVVKALQSYRWVLIFLPFVFWGSFHWTNWTGAIRQMMVGCAFLWASRFIYEKKLFKYLIFVFIGSLVHQSALILLPFYFMPSRIDFVNKRWLLISIFLVCVILGQIAAFSGLADYMKILANTANYQDYGERMSEMLQSGYDKEALSLGPMMMTYVLIPIFIIWYGPELADKYSKKIPYFYLWFNLSFLYSCAYFLVCNLGHIFIRPVLYLSVFQLVMASLLLCHFCMEYKKYGYRQMTTYFFCFVIALNTVWDVYKASNSGSMFECKTYKVFLFHSDQRKLFNL